MKHIAFALFISMFLITTGSIAATQSSPPLITVSGNAEVRVTPDEVIVTLGIETRNKDLKSAKNDNDQRREKILAAAKKHRIPDKDTKTDYISIFPRYHFDDSDYKLIDFQVRQTLVITLKDIPAFEQLLTDVLEAGATNIHGIEFRTTQLRKYKDQARELAIKAAKEKAAAMASELGVRLGEPYTIEENPVGWYSGYGRHWGSGWSGGMAQNVVQNTPHSQDNSSGLSVGQINVNAQVSVSFKLY